MVNIGRILHDIYSKIICDDSKPLSKQAEAKINNGDYIKLETSAL